MFPFNSNSTQSAAIAKLFNLEIVIAALILALVTTWVIIVIVRFRHRPERGEPAQVEGNRWLEITWTASPIILLLVLFGYTLQAMAAADPTVPATTPADLVVVGHQWWWEVHYPQSNVVTANEIHIPVGKRLLVEVTSADVIHSFWIPALARKADMIPTRSQRLWLQADKAGDYAGSCAEFCGAEHAWMRLRVVAQPPDEFEQWLAAQAQPAPVPSSGDAAQGAQLFQERTCRNCHAIAGTQATATLAPDLSHLASRQTLAAGVIPNTSEQLSAWLRDPQAIKPGTLMPNLQLSDSEIHQLVAYLETLQ